MVVSFLGLPAYIEDNAIIGKLLAWGVEAVSAVRRRMWPGTEVADGTRYVKVRFTELVKSLPYSVRFDTASGPEYFRVIHDRQVRVCRGCLKPGHVLRECPDFLCHKCGGQGHYARECVEPRARKCGECGAFARDCVCAASDEGSPDQVEDSVSSGKGGQGADSRGPSPVEAGPQNATESGEEVDPNVIPGSFPSQAPVQEGAGEQAPPSTSNQGEGARGGPAPNAAVTPAEAGRGMGSSDQQDDLTPKEQSEAPSEAPSEASDSRHGDWERSASRDRSKSRRRVAHKPKWGTAETGAEGEGAVPAGVRAPKASSLPVKASAPEILIPTDQGAVLVCDDDMMDFTTGEPKKRTNSEGKDDKMVKKSK